MAPWKKLLPKSANFDKFEKEERQKYKQYVKTEKQNAELRSKPESEVYEDFLLLRSKSSTSRRSSKKRRAPAPDKIIENSYEIIEGPSSNNVVVINDDLRNRFAGYELPKIQENVYVVVQPHQVEEGEKPRRLRWKKSLPKPPEPPITQPDDNPQEKTSPQPPKAVGLRVPYDDDQQETSMSEVYYDCEDYVEISPVEDPKEPRKPFALDKASGNPPIKTYPPNYDSISEGSLTRSYEAEYAEYDDYYEDQRVYNRYAVGEDVGSEDESRWQPSNVRFCEMSGDEDEQQIYGPFGTFEVANYQVTLNDRIQTVLENEIQSVMVSLEDQWKDKIDGEKVSGRIFLNPSEDDFGAADAFETEREDEEFLVEARNIALIDELEKPKKDDLDLTGVALSNLHEEAHKDIQTDKGNSSPERRFELTAKKVDGSTPSHSNLRQETHEDLKEAKNIDEPTAFYSNLREGIHEDPREAKNFPQHLKVPTPTNLHHEDYEEVQQGTSKGVDRLLSVPIPSKRIGNIEDVIKKEEKVTSSHPNLREGIDEDPKGAKIFPQHLKLPTPTNLHHEDYEEMQQGTTKGVDRLLSVPIPSKRTGNIEDVIKKEEKVTSSHPNLREGIDEDPKGAKNFPQHLKVPTPTNLNQEDYEEGQKGTTKRFDRLLSVPIPSKPTVNIADVFRKEERILNGAKQNESVQVPSSLDVGDIAQARRSPQLSSSSFLFDNYSAFLNDPMSMMSPRLNSRPSFKDDPKPTQRKENGDAYQNLQFNRSAPKEESPLEVTLHSSSKIEEDDPKPTTQYEENGDAYENFLFDRSERKEESPPHLRKSPRQDSPGYRKNPVAQPRWNLSSLKRNRLFRRSKSDLKPPKDEEEAGQAANATSDLFNGLPVEAELLERNAHKEDEHGANSRKTEAKTANQHELFNGLPVTGQKISEDKLNAHEESLKIPWETKPKMSTYFSTSKKEQVQSETFEIPRNAKPIEGALAFSNDAEVSEDKLNAHKENLKIPWETKPKMSNYFLTLKEEQVQSETFEIPRNAKPIEGALALSNDAEEEKIQNETVQGSWETKPPKLFSGDDEDTSIFFNDVKEGEVPWGTRPTVNTFAPFSKAFEEVEEFANPKEPLQVRDTTPKTSDGEQIEADGYENVQFERDSKTPEYANLKIPWKTKPSSSEQNKISATAVSNDPLFSSNKETLSSPEKLDRQISWGVDVNPQGLRNDDITSNTFAPLAGTNADVYPKELGVDSSKLQDVGGDDENAPWGSNPFDEGGTPKQADAQDSKSETFMVGLERSHSLKQKTWYVNLLEKYEIPNLHHHKSEADGVNYSNPNGENALIVDRRQKMNPATESAVNGNKAEEVETQNEANILEENYRILRGFDVAKEEGVVYHRDVLHHNTPVPPQRSSKKTKITKKVSFRISDAPDVSDEGPAYIPVHSPTEKIKRSATLEALTRRLEQTPRLQHSTSLIAKPEKPKPNFSTFPRRNSPATPGGDLGRLQQVLSGINDLVSVHEQVSALEDISNKVKEKVDKFDVSGNQNEYSELLQIMFRSVRIATTLDCGFDPDLLARQQTVLDEIRNNMTTLNSR